MHVSCCFSLLTTSGLSYFTMSLNYDFKSSCVAESEFFSFSYLKDDKKGILDS